MVRFDPKLLLFTPRHKTSTISHIINLITYFDYKIRYSTFLDKAIVDGRVRDISFKKVGDLVVAVIPHFWTNAGKITLFPFCLLFTLLIYYISFGSKLLTAS